MTYESRSFIDFLKNNIASGEPRAVVRLLLATARLWHSFRTIMGQRGHHELSKLKRSLFSFSVVMFIQSSEGLSFSFIKQIKSKTFLHVFIISRKNHNHLCFWSFTPKEEWFINLQCFFRNSSCMQFYFLARVFKLSPLSWKKEVWFNM